jgi:hypothetical protein
MIENLTIPLVCVWVILIIIKQFFLASGKQFCPLQVVSVLITISWQRENGLLMRCERVISFTTLITHY